MMLEPGELLGMLRGLRGTILTGKWREILPLEFEKKKVFFPNAKKFLFKLGVLDWFICVHGDIFRLLL